MILLSQSQELQLELLELESKIRSMRMKLADEGRIDTEDWELALDSEPVKLPEA